MPGYERLKRSLTEFDLVQPIVWNRTTGHIVGGHQRWQILKDRGDQTVECMVVELTLDREKALNVALNNSQVGGDWDQAKLIDLVAELQSLPDFDATLTGFDEADLKHLIFEPMRPASSQETKSGTADSQSVQVTLKVPRDDWDDARHALDEFLATYPEIRVHVQKS